MRKFKIELTNAERLILLRYVYEDLQKSGSHSLDKLEKLYELHHKLNMANMSWNGRDAE